MTAAFDTLRSIERREADRLDAHLTQLDDEGWHEQSYCAEWRIYQVVGHLASGARLLRASLEQWFDGGPPVTQEQRQRVWDYIDALAPEQVVGEFRAALRDYFGRLDALPSDAGRQEVETFLGTRTVEFMLTVRLQEVALHTWDVLVARDRSARIPADVVELLRPLQVQFRALRTPAPLAGKRVRLRTPEGAWQRLLDFRSDAPVLTDDAAAEADLTVDAPAEEVCRLLSGRHFLPGASPRLSWQGGSYQEVVALNIFGG